MQDLLDEVTAALQQGDDIEALISQSSVPQGEAEGLVSVIQSLQATLVPLEPTAGFAEELGAQLMNRRRSVVMRVRQMPARVHLAALLAVVAGCGLIVRRRSGAAASQDIAEEPVAS